MLLRMQSQWWFWQSNVPKCMIFPSGFFTVSWGNENRLWKTPGRKEAGASWSDSQMKQQEPRLLSSKGLLSARNLTAASSACLSALEAVTENPHHINLYWHTLTERQCCSNATWQLYSVLISGTKTAHGYCLSLHAPSGKCTLMHTHLCPLTGTVPNVLHLLCLCLLLPLIHKHNDLLPLAE